MIGIGTDLVDIDRFRDVLARTPGMRDRLFCASELAYADQSADPARPLAARFAAKEAALKSLQSGLGAMRFTEMEIVRHEDGHPELVLHGPRVRCGSRSRSLTPRRSLRRSWLRSIRDSDRHSRRDGGDR